MAAMKLVAPASPGQAAAPAAPQEWLTFRLGEEQYGIDILRVQEIRKFEPPTRIVGAPGDCLGVIDLRGVTVPIVDLRMRFHIAAGFDSATVTVVLNLEGRTVGAVVDAVSDVVRIPPADIRPAPGFAAAGADTLCITGLASVGERMLILLDIERLLPGTDPDSLSPTSLQK